MDGYFRYARTLTQTRTRTRIRYIWMASLSRVDVPSGPILGTGAPKLINTVFVSGKTCFYRYCSTFFQKQITINKFWGTRDPSPNIVLFDRAF